jgi:hypothetical protein
LAWAVLKHGVCVRYIVTLVPKGVGSVDSDIDLLIQLLKPEDILALFQVLELYLAVGPAGVNRDGFKEVLQDHRPLGLRVPYLEKREVGRFSLAQSKNGELKFLPLHNLDAIRVRSVY